MAESVIQLRCDCNNYPWGKEGSDSFAARLCEKTPGTEFEIDESKNYAEMWMGTYPELPSYALASGKPLQDILNVNSEQLIGSTVLKKYGTDLPFLPKILSIAKALPLQLHPNKSLSAQLHKENPDKFSDPNHKPEISVAFSKFEVFAGFKSLPQIGGLYSRLSDTLSQHLSDFRPASSPDDWTNGTLRAFCHALLTASEDSVKEISAAISKTPAEELGKEDSYILELLPRLESQYSKTDNGNLVALLTMNFFVLSPGEALYIPADGIHAYLSGDIYECMARSNNVLNVGFCPAADRDNIDTFTGTLTFKSTARDDMILPSKTSDFGKNGKTQIYAPALSEFNLLVTKLKKGEKETVAEVKGPSIAIVVGGSGKAKAQSKDYELKEGYIFFIGQGVPLELENEDGEELVVYRSYAA